MHSRIGVGIVVLSVATIVAAYLPQDVFGPDAASIVEVWYTGASQSTPTPDLTATPSPTSTPLPTETPRPTQTAIPNGPTLYISFQEGAPGSMFSLTGLSFRPVSPQVTILVNGVFIGAIPGSQGWFVFYLDTTNAPEGLYIVVTQTETITRSVSFLLDNTLPIRPRVELGPGAIFPLPYGIPVGRLFLPFLAK